MVYLDLLGYVKQTDSILGRIVKVTDAVVKLRQENKSLYDKIFGYNNKNSRNIDIRHNNRSLHNKHHQ